MFRRVCLSALLGLAACACAAENGPPPLDEEQLRDAEFIGNFSIPNAGEIFTAFSKSGKPDWSAFFRRQPPTPHTSRPLIALNLGTRIADGFLAAEAQDRQQVKNVSMEIKLLAKSLGLEQEYVGRSNSIADFADSRQWDALDEELDAVQGEIAAAMSAQRDDHLVALMSLGCWLRSVEIVSAQLASNYTTDGAKILRQPAVGAFFVASLGSLPARTKAIPIVAELQQRLPALDAALSLPSENPPNSGAVAAMRNLATGMVNLITAPEK
ncbi:MAG: hypothetical protein ABI318_02635 [Chthoniobacteraceae bacterium]